MEKPKLHLAILHRGLTRELVFCHKGFKVEALIFLNMTHEEAKQDIQEMAWQDRAEWVSNVPFRAYPGWQRKDVIEMEELNKNPNYENVYVDY